MKNEETKPDLQSKLCDLCGSLCSAAESKRRKELEMFPFVYAPGVHFFDGHYFGHIECFIAHRIVMPPPMHFEAWHQWWFEHNVAGMAEACL